MGTNEKQICPQCGVSITPWKMVRSDTYETNTTSTEVRRIDLVSECDRLRDEVERLKAYLSQQIAASNNILNSEVDCDYRYEQGCLAALKRVQRFLDSEEE